MILKHDIPHFKMKHTLIVLGFLWRYLDSRCDSIHAITCNGVKLCSVDKTKGTYFERRICYFRTNCNHEDLVHTKFWQLAVWWTGPKINYIYVFHIFLSFNFSLICTSLWYPIYIFTQSCNIKLGSWTHGASEVDLADVILNNRTENTLPCKKECLDIDNFQNSQVCSKLK